MKIVSLKGFKRRRESAPGDATAALARAVMVRQPHVDALRHLWESDLADPWVAIRSSLWCVVTDTLVRDVTGTVALRVIRAALTAARGDGEHAWDAYQRNAKRALCVVGWDFQSERWSGVPA